MKSRIVPEKEKEKLPVTVASSTSPVLQYFVHYQVNKTSLQNIQFAMLARVLKSSNLP